MPIAIGPKFSAQFHYEPKDFTTNHNYDNPKLLEFNALEKEFSDKFAPVGSMSDTVKIRRDYDWFAIASLDINGRYKRIDQYHFGPWFRVESKRSFFERLLKEAQYMASMPPVKEEEALPTAEPEPIEPTIN